MATGQSSPTRCQGSVHRLPIRGCFVCNKETLVLVVHGKLERELKAHSDILL